MACRIDRWIDWPSSYPTSLFPNPPTHIHIHTYMYRYKPTVSRAFVQTELGFDPSATAPPLPPSPSKTRSAGGNKGKGKGTGMQGKEPEELEEEDPTGLRFLRKAGVAWKEAPEGSGSFVVDPKESTIDPSAGNDRPLM